MENFDQFPVNIAETAGTIRRESFIFNYSRYEVWQDGQCIYSGNSKSRIAAEVTRNQLQIKIEDPSISNYINSSFSFSEISTNGNRILWSKDIFNTSNNVVYNTPDVSSLFYKEGILSKVTFTIHDPNTLVEFYLDEDYQKKDPGIITTAKEAIGFYENEDTAAARPLLVEIFRSVKRNPAQLKDVNEYSVLGKAFMLMLNEQLSTDIDNLQMMSSLGYLFLSKAIQKENDPNLVKDRLLVLRMGHDSLKYSVMSSLGSENSLGAFFSMSTGASDLKARDALYKMEIADLVENPILYLRLDFFKERKLEFDDMIANQFFRPDISTDQVVNSGIEAHKKLYDYLENMVIRNSDVDF